MSSSIVEVITRCQCDMCEDYGPNECYKCHGFTSLLSRCTDCHYTLCANCSINEPRWYGKKCGGCSEGDDMLSMAIGGPIMERN